MCGIIHCKRADNGLASRIVKKRYEKQKSRGSEGFGFIELLEGKVIGEARAQSENEIMAKLEKSKADEILFHHRYPTSTPNFIEATHPIKISSKKLKYLYYVVHNGIITNDSELYKQHILAGYSYSTKIEKRWTTKKTVYVETIWNDSEAIALDFVEMIEKGQDMQAKGTAALIALQVDKKTKKAVALYYGRNDGNPLKIENNRDFFCLSSESGKELPSHTLYRYDYKTHITTQTFEKIGSYPQKQTGFGFSYTSYSSKDYEEEDYTYSKKVDSRILEVDKRIKEIETLIEMAAYSGDYRAVEELEAELEGAHDELFNDLID